MNAREQLMAKQRAVLEEALVRELAWGEWMSSVACAFAFDLARDGEASAAQSWTDALAAAKRSTHYQQSP